MDTFLVLHIQKFRSTLKWSRDNLVYSGAWQIPHSEIRGTASVLFAKQHCLPQLRRRKRLFIGVMIILIE
jgi:hypothetical protein